ncbi:MAG: pre-peptidase C-terminal domain-containing protein [Acidimicrobiia bacterium]
MSDSSEFCTARVLPADVLLGHETIVVNGEERAVEPKGKRWPNGSTLQVRFFGGTAAQQAKVVEQANWWTAHANLRFDFGNHPQAHIRIAFDASDGAWSYIGTDCAHIPLDQPTMNLGFLTGGTPAHEFGHALGLGHEHQNPRGGIEWNEAEVIRSLSGPPNNWTEEQIRHNVLKKYSITQINGTDFDPDSIMLYFFPGSWVRSGTGTKRNEVLSAVDKSYIASAYPDKLAPVVKLAVNGPSVAATISSAGERDAYSFDVAATATHVIETSGSTDVVMQLFGPNSNTALIASDDDSGAGSNARISRKLVPGTYYAFVRHYRPKATGSYGIAVRRS